MKEYPDKGRQEDFEILVAKYVSSCVRTDKAPAPDRPEFAFIGRSNVGKSSLINMLTREKGLAKTSNTPGKTQTLNFYDINGKWYMVDLPGYGYARISKKLREMWEEMISYYMRNRETLVCVFVLVDSNIPPQKADLDFMLQLTQWKVPFAVILTKTDRLNQKERVQNIRIIEDALAKIYNPMPNVFSSSADRGFGRKDILEFVHSLYETRELQ